MVVAASKGVIEWVSSIVLLKWNFWDSSVWLFTLNLITLFVESYDAILTLMNIVIGIHQYILRQLDHRSPAWLLLEVLKNLGVRVCCHDIVCSIGTCYSAVFPCQDAKKC